MARPRQLPNPENCSLKELEQVMDCCPEHKAYRRLNAIHLLFLGVDYEHVLRNSRVSERMLRKWITWFNERGIDGLTYKPKPGRPRKLKPEEVAKTILPLVDDPQSAGQNHWTATKICGYLREEKGLEELTYPTLVRYLHEQDYARRIPRKMPIPRAPTHGIGVKDGILCHTKDLYCYLVISSYLDASQSK